MIRRFEVAILWAATLACVYWCWLSLEALP